MVALLDQLRSAPVVDPYTGPAILSGRASGVFFHEIFGHRIEGHRTKQSEDAQTFAKKLNQPILPAFLSVLFDPTRDRDGTTPLVGRYAYDDEGVPARPVLAVDKGVLKTFLMSRSPVAGIVQSNGHGRAMPGLSPVSRQSNLVVEASETVPFDDLVARLKREIRQQGRPFGLYFKNIEGGFTFTGRMVPNAFNVLPNLVYRIYPDDRPMELVRGVDLIGTPLTTFGRILAASAERETFNGMCGAESGMVPVSASAPALLIGEIEVQKKLKSQEGLPLLPAPPGRAKTE
jgi:predicted Zn-dependent protease